MKIVAKVKAEGMDIDYEVEMTEKEYMSACENVSKLVKYIPAIVVNVAKAFNLVK